jgi:hypothetical protein
MKLEIEITFNGRFCGPCKYHVDDWCGIWPQDREYEEVGHTGEFDYVRVDECLKAEKSQ